MLSLALVIILQFIAISHVGSPVIKTADIGHGIKLHYVEQGSGTLIVFVHGSLSDGGY